MSVRYLPPELVRWDGPQDARARVEQAVQAGVRRAIAAAAEQAPPHPDQPHGTFAPAGPDGGLWVLPSYRDGGAPVAVPVQEQGSHAEDAAAGIEGDYTLSELRGAIREAFPSTQGTPRTGLFYGIYGRLRGEGKPKVYYVRLRDGREILDSLILYFEPRLRGYQRVSLRSEERRVPLGLKPDSYTVDFDPGGGGRLFRHGKLVNSDLQNPDHLGLTVAFVVDPMHAPQPHAPQWEYVPVTRIAATNLESQLATGALSTYSAFTDIWRVDEYGIPQTINELAILGTSLHYRWEIWRLPSDDAPHKAPDLVHQVTGDDERAIRYTWPRPGQYEVRCTVTARGRGVSPGPVTDIRKERVIERQLKMALELELMERHEKEKHEQIWARSAPEMLAKAEADLRAEQAKPDRNEAKIDRLKEIVSKLRDQLFPAGREAVGPFPIHGVFMDKKTSQTWPVSLFLAYRLEKPEGSPLEQAVAGGAAEIHHWYLIDVTYPAFYRTYEGSGATAREALLAAFHDSETSFRRTYPPGQILVRVSAEDLKWFEIPSLSGAAGTGFTHTYETDSWQKDARDWLTLGLQAVGVLALAAAFVFPPSAGLTTVLVVAGVAGGALAVANIADRVAHGDFYWDVETFGDIASIVASIAQLGALTAGARISALAKVIGTAEELTPELIASLKLAEKAQRALLLTQLGTDAANGLILGYTTYEQLRMVDAEFDEQSLEDYQRTYGDAEGRQRWQQDRQNRITGIFSQAILGGTMIVVSTVGGVKAYRQLKSRAAALQELVGEPPPEPGAGSRPPAGPPPDTESPEPAGTAAPGALAPGTAPPPGSTKPQRFFVGLTRLANLRSLDAAAGALRLLPGEQMAEMVRLAELLDVPENASAKIFRAEAEAKGVGREVRQLADTLSLARRIERRAGPPGTATPEMTAALPRLIESGWSRSSLETVIDAVPRQALADWSKVVAQLRPDQLQRLGTRGLQALATSSRSLSFASEAGNDAYLAVLDRARGDLGVVEEVLQGLELHRAEIDPVEFMALRDRIVAGEATAYQELSRRISQAAQTALDRLRSGSRRQLREELEEFEEHAGRLRREGNLGDAAAQLAIRDRLAARISELGDQELDGLEQLARLGERGGGVNWEVTLDLPAADRDELLRLVHDVAGRLPASNLSGIEDVLRTTLERNVKKTGQLENAFQGGWGQLYAARTLIDEFHATALTFEVGPPGRVADIVAELPGRGRVSVEVKTNLAGQASFNEPQVMDDLVTHARSGYTDLMYLYHPDSANELSGVGQQMLQLFDGAELQALLRANGVDPAQAKAAFAAWCTRNLRAYRL